MTMSEVSSESGLSEGDRVTIKIPAKVIETYPDGGVLVNADGTEVLVEEDEIL